MAPLPRIELIARRQEHDIERPDYVIYAQDRVVGRIHRQLASGDVQQWFWGVQGVITSMEIGHLQGAAESFDQAKERLRVACNLWLAWAVAVPPSHLSYAGIRKDLRDVGAADIVHR